jgi:two-component system response regulator RegX3
MPGTGLPPAARTVLLVDGQAHSRAHLRNLLTAEGYVVVEAPDGGTALAALDQGPDLVLLELSLPDMSGLQLCRDVRERSDVAMIVVTTVSDEVDKVLALEIGADDYVTKPFLDRELTLRVKAVLRRSRRLQPPPQLVTAAPAVRLDARHQCAAFGDRQVTLSPREFRLMQLLVDSGGRLITRAQILTAVWGPDSDVDDKALDAQVRRLRDKIEEDPHHPTRLVTVRGCGYRLSV